MKKLVAAAFIAAGLVAAGTASNAAPAAGACVHAHIQVNDTVQDVDQCAP